ncbi:amino acid permease [Mycobacterium sp. 852013-50091_SCH5140682]|uniref:APC family permease n=1 Tax=Mycobacterium sp. 852013-50091_SCH5140682 TaxID=1834109 RepID=UPI0007E92B80|nr:amino acid permease [Mycobacterium sp. 852013-50091_SCH5140682]OBC10043.1 amino acid permease [Mycobacterium sp. 852013-50091_SCH5140682]
MTSPPPSPTQTFWAQLSRKQIPNARTDDEPLHRSLGVFQLAMIGVGCTIGTGIFFSLSTAVPKAGPAVVISFLIASVAAGLAALCYAELASSIPAAGSAYSYAYAAIGQYAAVGVAACLMLEYGVATAASAVGWAGYVNQLFSDLTGSEIPYWALHAPGSTSDSGQVGIINLPALILVVMCTVLLLRGVRESMLVNTIMVLIKLGVLAFFVAIAFTAFKVGNFSDFAPMGAAGVGAGTATIFFTFVGIDAISTAGEEVRDPRKTLPRAIILALGIVLTIYMLVAFAAVGAQQWTKFEGQEAGLSVILDNILHQRWPGMVLAAGAVVSIFSVTLVTLYGQTRILFSMGRDAIVSKRFASVGGNSQVPVFNTLAVALIVGPAAAFIPLDELADLTSIGTMVAFIAVAIALIMARRNSSVKPSFCVPLYPLTPILTVVVCCYVLTGLSATTWTFFAIWMVLTYGFYLWRGRKMDAGTPVAAVKDLSPLFDPDAANKVDPTHAP